MILKFGAFDKVILSDISTSRLARLIIVVDTVDILEMQAYGIPSKKGC